MGLFNRGSVSLVTGRSRVSDATMTQLRALVYEGDAFSLRPSALRRLSPDEWDVLRRKFLACEAGFLCDYIIDGTVYFDCIMLPSEFFDILVDYVVSCVMEGRSKKKGYFKDDYEHEEERERVFNTVSGRLDSALKGEREYMVVFGSLDSDDVETIACIEMDRFESDESYRDKVMASLGLDINFYSHEGREV